MDVMAAVALSLLAGACAPEMDPVSLVEKTRVIGARVEVEGAPERSTPRPGETVTVSWLMTSPDDMPSAMPPLGWAFLLCPGASGGDDLGCVGEPLTVYQGKDRPNVQVSIPARELLGGARELVLFGRICTASEPLVDPAGRPACTDRGDGTTAAVSIRLELDDWSNRNPALGSESLSFAGAALAGGGVGRSLRRPAPGQGGQQGSRHPHRDQRRRPGELRGHAGRPARARPTSASGCRSRSSSPPVSWSGRSRPSRPTTRASARRSR